MPPFCGRYGAAFDVGVSSRPFNDPISQVDLEILNRSRFAKITVDKSTWAVQWLKWSCEAGGSPDEARLEQTPYPFHTQLIWRYLGIK